MKRYTLFTHALAATMLIACGQGFDLGIDFNDNAAETGESGKADGASECDELRHIIEELRQLAARGDREAQWELRELQQELQMMEREGLCDERVEEVPNEEEPIEEPAEEEPIEEEPVEEEPVEELPGCTLDQDEDGILSYFERLEAERMPAEQCREMGGAVQCPPRPVDAEMSDGLPPSPGGVGPAGIPTFSMLYPVTFLQAFLEWVRRQGIHNNRYVADTYDCDDFADDLEKKVEKLGRDSGFNGVGTFTYTACDWDPAINNYKSAHALTDVHIGNVIFWVEPQTAQLANLDSNGDGKVDYVTDFKTWPVPTEASDDASKRCFVAVFDSAAAAVAAGLTLD